ncbi:hypothetical protein N9370_02360 [Paracoccaceae bacterium]|nr:hypothetical protein [Paracoccaceae bacterium]
MTRRVVRIGGVGTLVNSLKSCGFIPADRSEESRARAVLPLCDIRRQPSYIMGFILKAHASNPEFKPAFGSCVLAGQKINIQNVTNGVRIFTSIRDL